MRWRNSRKGSLPVRPSEQFMCLLAGRFFLEPLCSICHRLDPELLERVWIGGSIFDSFLKSSKVLRYFYLSQNFGKLLGAAVPGFFYPFWGGLPVIYEIVPHFSGAVRQVLYPCKTSKIFVEPLAFESMLCYTQLVSAGVMELVDVVDSKSTAGDSVPVRARSPAPKCVDKKDAQQKRRMKMRCFCVNAEKIKNID